MSNSIVLRCSKGSSSEQSANNMAPSRLPISQPSAPNSAASVVMRIGRKRNSAACLIDSRGEVIGVVVSKLNALKVAQVTGDIPQNVNFAIRGEIAKLFLSEQGVTPRTGAAGEPPVRKHPGRSGCGLALTPRRGCLSADWPLISRSCVVQVDASEDGTGRGTPLVPVAFDLAQITSKANRTRVAPELPASTLNAAGQMHCATAMQVRRLTPRECERLQGFPDDYTLIPYRGKPAADGPRYKALGNSMAVPCMVWIGRRIQMVEDLTNASTD
mgnify:CR=1 FL=1